MEQFEKNQLIFLDETEGRNFEISLTGSIDLIYSSHILKGKGGLSSFRSGDSGPSGPHRTLRIAITRDLYASAVEPVNVSPGPSHLSK